MNDISISVMSDSCDITYYEIYINRKCYLTLNPSMFSCGIRTLDGIENLIQYCEDNPEMDFEKLLRKLIVQLSNHSTGLILISYVENLSPVDNPFIEKTEKSYYDDKYTKILDKYFQTFIPKFKNPNSGNDINLKGIFRHDILKIRDVDRNDQRRSEKSE